MRVRAWIRLADGQRATARPLAAGGTSLPIRSRHGRLVGEATSRYPRICRWGYHRALRAERCDANPVAGTDRSPICYAARTASNDLPAAAGPGAPGSLQSSATASARHGPGASTTKTGPGRSGRVARVPARRAGAFADRSAARDRTHRTDRAVLKNLPTPRRSGQPAGTCASRPSPNTPTCPVARAGAQAVRMGLLGRVGSRGRDRPEQFLEGRASAR